MKCFALTFYQTHDMLMLILMAFTKQQRFIYNKNVFVDFFFVDYFLLRQSFIHIQH